MTKDEFIFSKLWPDGCWHKPLPHTDGDRCICGVVHFEGIAARNPDFTTWEGFGMLLEGMQRREDCEWEMFVLSKIYSGNYEPIDYDGLIPVELINPPVFRDTVFRWLGEEE